MYKLRFYKKTGYDKGNLDHEEFFNTLEEATERFKEVFIKEDYALNPTVWEQVTTNIYARLQGFG